MAVILLIDQGNSRLKWICVDRHGCIVGRGIGDRKGPIEETLLQVRPLLTVPLREVHASVVAGPERVAELRDAIGRLFGVETTFARAGKVFGGLTNGYLEASALGVDRWLAMVGGWSVRRAAMLVVDAGTALTIDGVGGDGQHLGGFITPGFQLQCESLGRQTAALPVRVDATPARSWGRSTDAAMANGVLMGMVALIREAQVELQASVADTCEVILTGGAAPLLREALTGRVTLDEDLVFRGLWATISPPGVSLHQASSLR